MLAGMVSGSPRASPREGGSGTLPNWFVVVGWPGPPERVGERTEAGVRSPPPCSYTGRLWSCGEGRGIRSNRTGSPASRAYAPPGDCHPAPAVEGSPGDLHCKERGGRDFVVGTPPGEVVADAWGCWWWCSWNASDRKRCRMGAMGCNSPRGSPPTVAEALAPAVSSADPLTPSCVRPAGGETAAEYARLRDPAFTPCAEGMLGVSSSRGAPSRTPTAESLTPSSSRSSCRSDTALRIKVGGSVKFLEEVEEVEEEDSNHWMSSLSCSPGRGCLDPAPRR